MTKSPLPAARRRLCILAQRAAPLGRPFYWASIASPEPLHDCRARIGSCEIRNVCIGRESIRAATVMERFRLRYRNPLLTDGQARTLQGRQSVDPLSHALFGSRKVLESRLSEHLIERELDGAPERADGTIRRVGA